MLKYFTAIVAVFGLFATAPAHAQSRSDAQAAFVAGLVAGVIIDKISERRRHRHYHGGYHYRPAPRYHGGYHGPMPRYHGGYRHYDQRQHYAPQGYSHPRSPSLYVGPPQNVPRFVEPALEGHCQHQYVDQYGRRRCYR